MSSFNRQHDGRSRPPPDRNRPGYHPPSSTVPQDVDPHYLQYLRTQAEQINQQLKQLTQQRGSPHYDHYQPSTNVRPMAPAQVSIPSSSHRQRPKQHRNPTREKSKWQFYAVKNGLNGDDVFSSWGQAHPYCWDPTTEYFFPGCFCKGFNDYHDAWNFLLNINDKPETYSTIQDSSIPLEPPEPAIPQEPEVVDMSHHHMPTGHTSSHLVPSDITDEESMATYDYNAILPSYRRQVPQKVHVRNSTTNDTTVSINDCHLDS